jgi:hypothetical protein
MNGKWRGAAAVLIVAIGGLALLLIDTERAGGPGATPAGPTRPASSANADPRRSGRNAHTGTPTERAVQAISDKSPQALREALRAGADPNGKNKFGYSLMYCAMFDRRHRGPGSKATKACAAMEKALLEAGADVDTPLANDETILHWACTHHHPEVTRVAIEKGADLNKRNDLGQTPLFAAVEAGQQNPKTALRNVKLLVDNGADFTIPSSRGVTPLARAVKSRGKGMAVIARYIERHGQRARGKADAPER